MPQVPTPRYPSLAAHVLLLNPQLHYGCVHQRLLDQLGFEALCYQGGVGLRLQGGQCGRVEIKLGEGIIRTIRELGGYCRGWQFLQGFFPLFGRVRAGEAAQNSPI